jgi:hypothetical protein
LKQPSKWLLKKRSNLFRQENLTRKILYLAKGRIGNVVSSLKELAVLAIKTGRERIDEDLLERKNSTLFTNKCKT